jgi:hypothetical protein
MVNELQRMRLWSLFITLYITPNLFPRPLCNKIMPTTLSARSKAWTVFARLNTGVVGSNPTQGIYVCVRLLCLLCSVCR